MRQAFNLILLLSVAVAITGCSRTKKEYKGEGYVLKIPAGWKIAKKKDTVTKLFMHVSEQERDVVTFLSPERNSITGLPDATISIFSQKFTQPLWVQDITKDISDWVRRQGNTILGSGNINYQGSVGFSINYRNEATDKIYLDFYFASDGRVYIIITCEMTEDKFQFYVPDFEEFRKNIKFPFTLF